MQNISIIDWLEKNAMPCMWKKYLGIECPGCGMQRAIIDMLKGDFWGSLIAYSALLPIFFMIIFLMLHLKLKFKHGAKILQITFIFVLSIIIINYIYKFI